MSEGMICSLQELGQEDSSEGIEIIDEGLALKHKLGTPGSNLLQLNDFIPDFSIRSLSHFGDNFSPFNPSILLIV